MIGVGALGLVGLVVALMLWLRSPSSAQAPLPGLPGTPAYRLPGNEPLPPGLNTQHVDLLELYPAARDAALRKDPHLRLLSIWSSALVGGIGNFERDFSQINYIFESLDGGASPQLVVVAVNQNGMLVRAQRSNGRNPVQVAEPRCPPAQLWQAGSPRTPQGQIAYGTMASGKPGSYWEVQPEGNGAIRRFDNSTCREVPP